MKLPFSFRNVVRPVMIALEVIVPVETTWSVIKMILAHASKFVVVTGGGGGGYCHTSGIYRCAALMGRFLKKVCTDRI